MIDSILEHNSNLLNYQCCRGSKKANNEIYQKSSETREKKLKTSPDKNRSRDSNRNNTNVTVRKHNDKRSQSEGKDKVRGNKAKKDIVIIDDSMIKYVNGWEISRSSSVKVRSHPGASWSYVINLIDYCPKKNKNDDYSLWYQ